MVKMKRAYANPFETFEEKNIISLQNRLDYGSLFLNSFATSNIDTGEKKSG